MGYKKDVKIFKGENIKTNQKKNSFNLLISINTINYPVSDYISKCLEEYSKVLKQGGVVIIETPSINHQVFKKAKKIGEYEYVWKYKYFRKIKSSVLLKTISNLKAMFKIL